MHVKACNHHYMSTDPTATIRSYLLGRVPEDLFDGDPEVVVDREEITVIGPIPVPERAEGVSDDEYEALVEGRVAEFRERTRQQRIRIARELERRYDRKVAWGVRIGDRSRLFTHVAVPVMTRLRQPERQVLDTLVESGVARSRADALAWCVRLVGRNSEEWLGRLREAMTHVEKVRAEGPTT
jgi:hypothetical protein